MVCKGKNRTEHGRFEPVFGSVQKLEKQLFQFDYLFWPKIGPNQKYSPLLLVFLIIIIDIPFQIPSSIWIRGRIWNVILIWMDLSSSLFIYLFSYVLLTHLSLETSFPFQIAWVKKIICVNLELWLNCLWDS